MPRVTDPVPGSRRHRLATVPPRVRIAALVALAVIAALLVLATLPVAPFRHAAERRLSAALGRSVTIDRIARLDAISFAPRLRLTGVRIAQPVWAGPGDMLVAREAIVRVAVFPALLGRARPRLIAIAGAEVALVHDAGTRANWRPDARAPADRPALDLGTPALRDVRVTFSDARRHLRMAGTVASDAAGVRLRASGTHRGTPAQAVLTGAPALGAAADARWPFHAAFASSLARIAIAATADRAFDVDHFTGSASADADDLKHLDDLLLIGLIDTQRLRASAQLHRTGDRWVATQARAIVGRSDLAGTVTVDRRDGRTRIDARVRAQAFDFADLANATTRARSAARNARTGPRIFPDPPLSLAKLRTVDGRLDFSAARLTGAPPIFRGMAATVVLDHARLTIAPLTFTLAHGRLEGTATIAHPAGRTLPRLTLDLALVGGRLEDLLTGAPIAGPLRGRARLTGDGLRLRAALARADGSVAFASRGGAIAKTAAELLGRDMGAAFALMIGGSDTRTPLRCIAGRFAARGGRLTPTLFALDAGVMTATGRGDVNLADESLALILDGRSKHPGLVRLPAPIAIRGTLSAPLVGTRDAGVGSARTILKALGQAVGRLFEPREPPAPDLDCGALIAKVGV